MKLAGDGSGPRLHLVLPLPAQGPYGTLECFLDEPDHRLSPRLVEIHPLAHFGDEASLGARGGKVEEDGLREGWFEQLGEVQ